MAEAVPTPAAETVEEKEAKEVETTEESAEEMAVRKEKERTHRRLNALNELLSTEETYNQLLGFLMHNYVLPLQDSAVISEAHYMCLFASIGTLKGLSDKFLEELRKKVSKWNPETSRLSDLFKTFAHFFKVYLTYVNNYDNVVALLSKLETRQNWADYSRSVRSACDGFNVASLLILPVSRIPRYQMLLGEMLRHSVDTHVDFEGLKQAYDDLLAVTKEIIEVMRESERKEQIRKIERLFTTKLRLLETGRVFIRKGKLWKVCRSKDRVYHFFLFNDLLLYASLYGTKMNLHNSLNIDAAFCVRWVHDAKYVEIKGSAFEIVSSKKSFVAYASCVAEARDWFEDLQKAATVAMDTTTTVRAHASGESADLRVADARVDKCSIDECETKFSFMQRRHFCRKCGTVVCGKCSKYKLPNAGGIMQRTCKRCFFEHMGESAMDDYTSEDVFQSKANALKEIDFYVESEGEFTVDDIFAKFGRGDGSYFLMRTAKGDDVAVGGGRYLVQLHVCTLGKVKSFDVAVVCKKCGVEFRLSLEHTFKDFVSMKRLIENIQKKQKILFSYAIQCFDVYNFLAKTATFGAKETTSVLVDELEEVKCPEVVEATDASTTELWFETDGSVLLIDKEPTGLRVAATLSEVGGGGKGKQPPYGGKKKSVVRKPPPSVLKSCDTTAIFDPIPLADILTRNFDESTVNAKQLEDYLSDEDFVKVFGMDRDSFKCVPKWKQVRMKKVRRLF